MASSPPLPEIEAGPFRFRCDHGWARLPPNRSWGITHAVAIDRSGRIYIAHTGDPAERSRDTVRVFHPDGSFLCSWGEAHRDGAHGLEIAEEDGVEFAYLTDLERGLFKYTLEGELVWSFDRPSLYQDAFGLHWRPSNVAFAPGTDLYLADGYGSAFIVRIDRRTGQERGLFGGPGREKANLYHPHGLAVDTRPKQPELLVADNVRNRLCAFDLDGSFLREDLVEAPQLVAPRHIVWLGDLAVIPDLGGCLHFLGKNNRIIATLGQPERPFQQQVAFHQKPPDDCPPGCFRLPHDAAFDADGNLYVVEWIQGGRVSKLYRC